MNAWVSHCDVASGLAVRCEDQGALVGVGVYQHTAVGQHGHAAVGGADGVVSPGAIVLEHRIMNECQGQVRQLNN